MKHAVWTVAFWLGVAPSAHAFPAAAAWDLAGVRAANQLGAPALDAPMHGLSHSVVVAATPLVLSLAQDPGLGPPLVVGSAEALAMGTTMLLKPLFQRARPFVDDPSLRTPDGRMEDDPYGFPSGHAAVSFAAASALADVRPGLAIPAYGLAALISYSRLYNGLHYPSDVLAGALLGFGLGKLASWGYQQLPADWHLSTVAPASDRGLVVGFSGAF